MDSQQGLAQPIESQEKGPKQTLVQAWACREATVKLPEKKGGTDFSGTKVNFQINKDRLRIQKGLGKLEHLVEMSPLELIKKLLYLNSIVKI